MIARMLSAGMLVSLALSLGGCAFHPPARNAGPAISAEGVQLAVTGQRCVESEEPDRRDNNLAEATLQIMVKNATAAPLTVHRDEFRLVTAAPRRAYLKTMTWGAADPLTVAGGATQTFELRFMNRGSLRCASDLLLTPDAGLAVADRPLKLAAIAFRPSGS
jgi:hypothetical protein